MRRKTVAIWSGVIFLIVIGIGVGYKIYDNDTATYDMWSSRWGITIPKPAELVVVFESEPSFHGDGEGYYVLNYNEEQLAKVQDQALWQPITEESRHSLEGEVSRFTQSIILVSQKEIAKYGKLYKNYPTEYDAGDYYYYKKKEDGSYCIVILNVDKQRLYLMEWIQ
ncbi:hypothetical protein NST99_21390 [Paenibacillus sp. FSL L8-0470]|uniref:hypothetical protein n=1 Tax=unclassified Paenibacillus TaxID=185978 RepID=UPI0030F52336